MGEDPAGEEPLGVVLPRLPLLRRASDHSAVCHDSLESRKSSESGLLKNTSADGRFPSAAAALAAGTPLPCRCLRWWWDEDRRRGGRSRWLPRVVSAGSRGGPSTRLPSYQPPSTKTDASISSAPDACLQGIVGVIGLSQECRVHRQSLRARRRQGKMELSFLSYAQQLYETRHQVLLRPLKHEGCR